MTNCFQLICICLLSDKIKAYMYYEVANYLLSIPDDLGM